MRPKQSGSAELGEGLARAEQFILSLFLLHRAFHLGDQLLVVPVLLDRYSSGVIPLVALALFGIESVWLARRAWRRRAYRDVGLVSADGAFAALAALSAALAGPPLPPVPSYAPGIVQTAALGAGVALRRVGVALAISMALAIALLIGFKLGSTPYRASSIAPLSNASTCSGTPVHTPNLQSPGGTHLRRVPGDACPSAVMPTPSPCRTWELG
jgi:hypothetical protein